MREISLISQRPSLAYFSPLPPAPSGIADYSRELLPYLAREFDITLFTADPDSVAAEIKTHFAVHHLDDFALEQTNYDLNLYHMGNSANHFEMVPFLLRFPGVVVLHDYFLHHFQVARTIGQGDWGAYAREAGFATGAPGIALAQAVRRGLAQPPLFELPLNERVMAASVGIIAHSQYVVQLIREQGYGGFLQMIPALIEPHPGHSRRRELNLAAKSIIFGSFGQITTSKQIAFALRCFRQAHTLMENTHFLLVGAGSPDLNVDNLVRELGLAGAVTHMGHVDSLQTFVDWIHSVDVVVNLRYPTVGETSATALRALAAGRPLIVFDHGWYSEIPAEAAIKLPPLDESAFTAAMLQLAQSAPQRQKMGAAGQKYTLEMCHPAVAAAQYSQFIHQILLQGILPDA